MDFGDSPDESAFRIRLRTWLQDNNPGLPASSTDDEYWAGMAAWHRSLYDAGFFAMSWPTEIGGQGLSTVFEVIVDEELAAAPIERIRRSQDARFGVQRNAAKNAQ